ncbi:MAG: hypothetical protein JW940_03845 [Polyangiaceae bacterium]|nr:hypothetical protein [Polyangiaceae bacterium]
MALEPISAEEKRQALERVLGSRTFGRSEQLRSFLRYICEAEFEGRAQQLNEYALGVSVLGRPANYSPAEDSCVRSRAYELRNKLKSYYRAEAPSDPIQIHIDKGAYVPRFERRAEPAPAESVPPPADASAPENVFPPSGTAVAALGSGPRRPLLSIVALGIAVLLAVVSAYFWWDSRKRPELAWQPASREMEALWRPFVVSDAPLLISFEIRLFFFSPETGLVVRHYLTNQVAEAAQSKPLQNFQQRMGERELRETFDYADFGAVHAAFLLGRALNRDVSLKHSNSLGWEDVWNSNIIFIGKPNLHPTIVHVLQDAAFVDETSFVRNLHPRPGERAEYPNAETHGSGVKYAVITVRPGPQLGRRMMILSGAGSELEWALAESVTNPARVREIVSPLLLPSGELPAAFQVLIQATFESNVPVKIRYVTHRVSKAP